LSRVALVVDDSMLIRHTVCRFLEERGFAVESATNGIEALEILKTVLPDLIVTDLSMPKMDGREFIAQLKAQAPTKSIPIFVLSARQSAGSEAQPPEAKAIIYKDIDIENQMLKALAGIFGVENAR
jgi:two-component system chemotaxis response regulator CheY